MKPFILNVETDAKAGAAAFRLSDEDGVHRGAHQVRLADHPLSCWDALFDTRAYLRRYAGNLVRGGQPATDEELLNDLGVFLGEHVLGREITAKLAQGSAQRTLLIRLPDTSDDLLAAAFARVPWELARPSPAERPLMARNVAMRVRMVGLDPSEEEAALELKPGETLRVLLVFAQAPGSRPLAMRLERERLLALFAERVLPEHRVEVEVLCHGVNRLALEAAIREVAGYHVVHWSGHGHHDQIELMGPDGKPERLSGSGLVELFSDAGGFIPRLVFLSACHSGAVGPVRDWESFRASLQDPEGVRGAGPEPGLGQILDRRGYTSTALELIRAGVPQVVAMRYAVGDSYARDLAVGFYEHLLADRAHHPADRALALARGRLWRSGSKAYSAVDHATPLILGPTPQRIALVEERSPQLARWRPQPQPLLAGWSDLDPSEGFVGRDLVLSRLAAEWLPREGPAVALIQGLAGLEEVSDEPGAPPAAPLLGELCDAGLLVREEKDRYAFHELVRERAEAWGGVGWICQNWAGGLQVVGQLERARETYYRGAEADRRAGSPAVNVVGSELEALRVDVKQVRAEEALPGIEEHLEAVRGWWRRHRAGETVPEAPESVALGRAMVSALDVAEDANRAMERWEPCLGLLAEIEEVKRAQGASRHEQACNRFNRYFPLLRLDRLAEAKEVVEGCLEVFREVDDLAGQAAALSALADIWNQLGDASQAMGLTRRALAVQDCLPNPNDRAISHANLASYLEEEGVGDEARRHRLAALIYDLVTGHRERLMQMLRVPGILIREAAASGSRYALPRLADLLDDPGFQALGAFLGQIGVDRDALQAEIDARVQEAERAVGESD